MTESSINDLEIKDYSESPRIQENIFGQRSSIRFFDPKDREDMRRLKETCNDPKAKKWMDELEEMEDDDFIEWSKEQGKGNSFLFAIAGEPEVVTKEDIGETQGFVYFYSEASEKRRAARLEKEGMLPKGTVKGQTVFEISYATFPDSPPKQVSSALRQACIWINNHAGNVDEDSLEPKMIVMAFISPENSESRLVLEAAGFEKKGETKYDKDSEEKDEVYILNWKLLNDKLKESSLQKISPQLRNIPV